MLVKYDEGLLQVSNAIRNYCGLETYYDPDKDVLKWIKQNNFRQIQVYLIDGMGSYLVKEKMDKKCFLVNNMFKEMPTVMPACTTAATTSFLSGKSPKETGWIGWSQYFEEKDQVLTMFNSSNFYGCEVYPGFCSETIKVRTIFDDLDNLGIKYAKVFPSWDRDGSDDLGEVVERSLGYAKQDYKLVYCYYDRYDATMHRQGTNSDMANSILKDVNDKLTYLSEQLPDDVGLLILADHGHVDVELVDIGEYDDLLECLERPLSLEARCVSFKVKDGMHKVFEEKFKKYFNDDFVLMSRDDVHRMNIFGVGKAHERFDDFIQDYVALCCTNKCFSNGTLRLKGEHSGTKEREIMVPLILSPKLKRNE